jgi:hypothetical protein
MGFATSQADAPLLISAYAEPPQDQDEKAHCPGMIAPVNCACLLRELAGFRCARAGSAGQGAPERDDACG